MFRKYSAAVAAFAVLVSGIGVTVVRAQAPTQAPAATVDEIVAKNYASKGGLEKWKSIQTQKMEGVASAQGFELGMVVYGKRPNMGRQDLTIEIPGNPPVTMVNVFDGQKAWMINPMTGSDAPQEMTGPEADTVRDQSDFDGALVDYKAKGYTVELVGTVAVGPRQAHHLKVTRKALPLQHYFVDVETGVELKITTEAPGGAPIETELSDYKLVDGVQVPHRIRVSQGGTEQALLRISKVEFNVPLDDAIFKVK
jgi:outer membrane lipoprotein-sorting protein